MIEERICYAVLFIVEAAIAWFYFSTIYTAIKSRILLWVEFSAGYFLLFMLSYYKIFALNSAMFFAVNLFLLIFNYNCSIKSGVLQAAFLAFSNGIAEVLSNFLLTFLGHDYDAYTYNFTIMVALIVLSKLLYLIIIFISAKILRQKICKLNQDEHNLSLLLGIMPIVSAFIVVTVTYVGMTSALTYMTEIMLTISMLALLSVNLGVLIIYGRIQTIASENMALNISKVQDKAAADYYLLLKEQYDNQQILIHDIKKHFGSINELLKVGDITSAKQYIERLEKLPALGQAVKLCDNPLLNVILYQYKAYAHDIGISFTCDIRTSKFSFVDATSTTALFSNLLSNAFEAAEKSEEKSIDFSITYNPDGQCVIISLTNSCDIAPKIDSNGNYKTSKQDQNIHGYGIKSIERVVREYSGMSASRYDSTTRTFHYTIRFPVDSSQLNLKE